MKRFLSVTAGLAVIAAPAFAGSLLINGDLELPAGGGGNDLDGWLLIEPDVNMAGAPVNSAEVVGFANHTPGGMRGLWFRSFEGGLNAMSPATVDAILQQDVAGTAGEQYTLSAWYRYEANYSGLDPFQNTQTILAIDFLDAGAGVIDSVALDIDSVINVGMLSEWQQFSVSDVAPAGTVSVRARASFLDGVLEPNNPQSAFVDDFSLVPEPTSLGLLLLAGAFIRRR